MGDNDCRVDRHGGLSNYERKYPRRMSFETSASSHLSEEEWIPATTTM